MRRRVALGAVMVALALGAFGFSRLKLYVSEDPGFCAHCHKTTPEFSAWTRGQHRGTPCQSCHHSTPEQGVAMLRAFLVQGAPAKPRRHAEVEVGSCAACHLSHDPNWPQVGASRGHRIHVVEQKIACVKCHATGIHRFEPAASSCKECHGPHTINVQGMQQVHCFACHNFTTSGADLKPTQRECLSCHRAQGVLQSRFPDDAPMQFACSACHKPHVQTAQMRECRSCHETIGIDGLHARAGHGHCADCHRQHVWRSEREDCLGCHPATAWHHGDKPCAECHPFKAPHPQPE